MIKKMVLGLMVGGMLMGAVGEVQARDCIVTSRSDSVNLDRNFTFRHYINLYNDDGARANEESVCKTSLGVYQIYDNSIFFTTDAWNAGPIADKISLAAPFVFENDLHNLIIGNPNEVFGEPTILDATDNFDWKEHPFECAPDSENVYLRRLEIKTNCITKAEFFDPNNPKTACLKDAEDVTVDPGFQCQIGNILMQHSMEYRMPWYQKGKSYTPMAPKSSGKFKGKKRYFN